MNPLASNSAFQFPEQEYTIEEAYQRGQQAALLLHGTPLFQEAFQYAEHSLMQDVLAEEYPILDRDGNVTGYRDPVVETYAAKKALLGLSAVEAALRAFMSVGEAARTELVAQGFIGDDE